MVEVRLFGGVRAVVDGHPVDVGPAKAQALLAVLALSPGAAVPVSRLVEVLWGDDPPRTAEKTLQTYATAVRKALGPESLTRVGAAYRLEVEPDAVDVVRFERLVATGRVDEALAVWTAPPLAGLDAPGLGPIVDALGERRLVALESDLERRVDADPAAVVPTLTELTAAHPFREGLWALLMTALYRVGRQADALAAFRTARRLLVDELGVEPGPRLRELEAAVLAQAESLAPAAPAGSSNLPRREVRLVSRDEALADVVAALDHHSVVTLVGPGGVGKTSLSLAAAQRVAPSVDAAWLVELDQIGSSAEVPRAVAAVVRVPEGPGQTVTQALLTGLADRRALLVLDNCEHVVDGAAELARAVAAGCPGVTVLATSRERLGIVGEQVVPVDPLPAAGAAELFAERARSVDPAFDLDRWRAEVEEICRRVDGLPLAVELAAARVATLAPADLLARLDDRLRLLGGARAAGGDRHRSLRAAIEWSHELLGPAEQVVWRRLAVFAGRFDVAAAEAVVADPDGPLDEVAVDEALAALVDRSMVVAEPVPSGRRFRLLAAMRQLAGEQLAEAGEAAVVAGRHTSWVLSEVRDVRRRLAGWEEAAAVDDLSERWPDLRAAVDRAITAGDRHLARDLIDPVAPEVFARSRSEIADWVERILELTPPDDTDTIAWGLVWAARRYMRNQDHAAYERLVARHGEPDDPLVCHARAFVYEDAEALVDACPAGVAELRRRGDEHLAAVFEVGVGRALLMLGRLPEHDEVMVPLVERFRADGPPSLLAWSVGMLGYSALRQGRRAGAERWFAESVAVELPARTHSRAEPIRALAALRDGHRDEALRLLRSYAAMVLDLDNLHEARALAREVVTVATRLDRRAAVARLRRALESPESEPDLDDRRLLLHIEEVLDQLLAEG